VAAFASDAHLTGLPVNVVEPETDHYARP
jgi:hypothetical protein